MAYGCDGVKLSVEVNDGLLPFCASTPHSLVIEYPNSIKLARSIYMADYRALTIRGISPRHSGQLGLPLVAVGQQLLLVVKQFLPRLRSILCIRRFDDRVDWAAFLA